MTRRSCRDWCFAQDNGANPQMKHARFYADNFDTMLLDNIGYLLWGSVGTGKSFFSACIANALMEKEIPVRMTNFAAVLNDLSGQVFEDGGKVRHADRDFFLHQGVGDTGGEKALARPDAAPEQIADIIKEHRIKIVGVKSRVLHLRICTIVLCEAPVPAASACQSSPFSAPLRCPDACAAGQPAALHPCVFADRRSSWDAGHVPNRAA